MRTALRSLARLVDLALGIGWPGLFCAARACLNLDLTSRLRHARAPVISLRALPFSGPGGVAVSVLRDVSKLSGPKRVSGSRVSLAGVGRCLTVWCDAGFLGSQSAGESFTVAGDLARAVGLSLLHSQHAVEGRGPYGVCPIDGGPAVQCEAKRSPGLRGPSTEEDNLPEGRRLCRSSSCSYLVLIFRSGHGRGSPRRRQGPWAALVQAKAKPVRACGRVRGFSGVTGSQICFRSQHVGATSSLFATFALRAGLPDLFAGGGGFRPMSGKVRHRPHMGQGRTVPPSGLGSGACLGR